MKLDRLASTTQRLSPESSERARQVAGERIRRVAAMDAAEGDRKRSLQQEMAVIEPGAIDDFNHSAHVLQEARDLAAQVTALGAAADNLLKPVAVPTSLKGIDDSA